MVEAVINAAAHFNRQHENVILVARATQVDESGTTKRYLKLSDADPNHITFLGPSGFRKTTAMKAFIQEVWLKTAWGRDSEKPLIIVFEAKYDKAKAQEVRRVFYQLLREKGEAWLAERLSPETFAAFALYAEMLTAPGMAGRVGLMGDFALGWPNILGLQKIDARNTELSNFGLKAEAFPIRRFVFNPTRELHHIAYDSGPGTEIIATNIKYSRLNFSDLVRLLNLSPTAIYSGVIREAWDNLRLRNPNDVIHRAKEIYEDMLEFLEVGNVKPNMSLWGVKASMERLKSNSLFVEDNGKVKDLLDRIDNDKINVIDFSANSRLTIEEKKLIFRKVVEYLRDEYSQIKETAVFIVGDEIQRYLDDHSGRKLISSIFREGRSVQINFFSATQYLHSLPSELVYGAAHVAILGFLTSADDVRLLRKLIPDFELKYRQPLARSPAEVEKLRKELRGRGYLITNKMLTERVQFRPSQTL